ncbi:MAG: ABC transporter permease [Oscillospiraceae bacterium]|jgi:peptide/nickel transport system permease protein|nr:ABC transporter permease [Oscillospiraceae bacterium]
MKKFGAEFWAGAALIALIAAVSLIGLFSSADYNAMDAQSRFLPPGAGHILGTDNLGRDIFVRVAEGGRHTLAVALAVSLFGGLVGGALGLCAGYAGGILNEVVMRLMDAVSSFPGILLSLALIAALGGGQGTLILALVVIFVPLFCRVARNSTAQYKARDFVRLAELTGVSRPRIVFVHILPNFLPALTSAFSLGLGNAILAEAGMSYLGLGIPPPAPSWGRMLAEAQNHLFEAPWCALAPGLAIMLTVLGFNLLAEGIRKRYA